MLNIIKSLRTVSEDDCELPLSNLPEKQTNRRFNEAYHPERKFQVHGVYEQLDRSSSSTGNRIRESHRCQRGMADDHESTHPSMIDNYLDTVDLDIAKGVVRIVPEYYTED